MIVSLAILDKKGKCLIHRNYRDFIFNNIIDEFNQKLLEYDQESSPPIIPLSQNRFLCLIHHLNVKLVALTYLESNALTVFSFLESFKHLLIESFKVLDLDSVKENIILIYELMDEICNGGHPQVTDPSLLKKYITTAASVIKNPKKRAIGKEREMASGLGASIPWRSENFKYSKNEVFLDVIENVNMIMNSDGKVLRSDVEGRLHMKSHLSGMPELILGLNDKKLLDNSDKRSVDIQDINFHQCVRLARFEDDRTISFIPPDGEFDLITYRIECPFKGLFSFNMKYEQKSERRFQIKISVKSNYKQGVVANFVDFMIPVSNDLMNLKSNLSHGEGKFIPNEKAFSWKVHHLTGKKEINADISFDIPINSNPLLFKNQPIRIMFEIPYYTLSGVVVRFLKIKDKSNYSALSWVRYLAKNGECLIRNN